MPSTELLLHWVVAFAITQCVECPIYVFGFGAPLRLAFAASLVTHPFASVMVPELWRWIYGSAIARSAAFVLPELAYYAVGGAMAETFAVVVEAWMLHRFARWTARKAFSASLVANAASVAAGGLAYLVTGWP
ncbi:MAG: hypothetical protein KIS78_10960 [Labilithrix sp.]|nr:hypothetical protein [Labilithrix sp.]